MSGSFRLAWRGRRRSLGRVLLLFAVTAGAYWPIWLAQIIPSSADRQRTRRRRIAIVAAALVPGVNVLFEILLALLLPRAVRRLAENRTDRAAEETEAQTFLLLAAPFAAIALALALGLPAWLVGYIAWPLELPAALVVQRALNRFEPPARQGRQGPDGEVAAAGAMGAAIVVGVVLAIVLGGEDKKASTPASEQQIEKVSDVAATPQALWVTRILDNAVEQIDRTTLRPTGRRVRVGRSPYDIASGYGDLWVADYRNDSVSRIDPRTARVKGGLIRTGRGPFGVAVGYGGVWVTNEVDRNVVEIDPGKNEVRKMVTVGLGPRGVDVGEGAVWVAGAGSSSVVRVDPRSGATKRIPVPALCQDVAVGGGSVWAAIPQANAVVRIDPARGRRTGGLISVGLGPASIDYGAGKVWVANGGDGTVTRIDARTGKVIGKAQRVGSRLTDISVDGRNVWVLRADGIVRRIAAR
jgi:DNA-binding beta-propeller fold protein YncE